ncbi:hypothetical protein KUA17_15230 [Vibrio parahaemolyticus]|uniref:hypothetical protein n=1 Tax=Vibrio harveyi group TaxID=717610 RepID=UPI001F44A7B2|nr:MULTISPECIES: hypothetical protein [Vibrio harveyi group]MCG0029648.1 hypothetical protein [Vibrio parahaemolyticus]MCS0438236.1 hypothetical protein [Vibrio diabolicus]
MSVEFRVYDLERFKGSDHFYDYIEFDVINYDRERVLNFSIFLDELPTLSERKCSCLDKCGCTGCEELRELERMYVDAIGSEFNPWPVTLEQILSPRYFKFTEKKQTVFKRNPSSYDRPSQYISRSELAAIFSALQEALKRHHGCVKTVPYLAIPYNDRVDSMYQKVLNQKIDVALQFRVTRSTMVEQESSKKEVIYVLQ